MLVSAAICPAPPLLARELTGADPVLPELRQACLDATVAALSAEPDVVVVVGVAEQARGWDTDGRLDLSVFAPSLRGGPGGGLPVSLGLGCMLLGQAGFTPRPVLYSVTPAQPAHVCATLGARLAGTGDRVAMLVMADGSARRGLKAPGYLDERSLPFDAEVERAIRSGDVDALLRVDAELARALMATGRPAWQVLAGAARGGQPTAQVHYRDDPFGVFYLVSSLRWG